MANQNRDHSVEQWLRKTPAPAAPGDLCLDAETLAAWAEGELAEAERVSAEAHASTCARCQAMLAVMVRTTPVAAASSGSAIRKWLMMLSPAMAAAAAVAVWFAVDQRQSPVSSPVDRLSKEQAAAASPSPMAGPGPASLAAPAPAESDRTTQITSSDRDAQKQERLAPSALADARRDREAGPPSAAPATPTPVNERKDLEAAKRSETGSGLDRLRAAAPPASLPPPPPPAPMPAPKPAEPVPAEGLQAAAGTRTPPTAAPPGPAPQQQANQAQNQFANQNQNQAAVQTQSPAVQTQQTQSQSQAPRQQAPAALEERVTVSEKPVGRAAADNPDTGRAAGRGGATGGLADAAKLAYRAKPGEFELAVADSSVRWRVVDGRTVQRSLDAGANFSTQYTADGGVLLTAGAAPSANVCWLVGPSGTVLLTTDGRVWQRLTFPEQVDLTAVTATDARTAAVTTADGRRFGTSDGGRNWTRR